MELIIERAVVPTATPNSYEVVINTMRGDADGYEDVIVKPFIKDQDEASLFYLLETLERTAVRYPYGRGGGDSYSDVEGFNIWFDNEFYEEEADYLKYADNPMPYAEYAAAKELVGDERDFDWPYETDYDAENSYVSHAVFYYDTDLVKYNVTVVK
jgi:hypothetical protein